MESKYVLAGWEYNDFWNVVELYMSDVKGCDVRTTDVIEDATVFDENTAQAKRHDLQQNYPDYGWYLLRLND